MFFRKKFHVSSVCCKMIDHPKVVMIIIFLEIILKHTPTIANLWRKLIIRNVLMQCNNFTDIYVRSYPYFFSKSIGLDTKRPGNFST